MQLCSGPRDVKKNISSGYEAEPEAEKLRKNRRRKESNQTFHQQVLSA